MMRYKFINVAWGVAYGIAALIVAMLIVSIAASICMTVGNYAQEKSIHAYSEEYLPGQPLDAVRVNAPTFSDCEYAYKSCDRTSGASGWYVRIDGQWVYMPVTLGNQQLVGAPEKVGE